MSLSDELKNLKPGDEVIELSNYRNGRTTNYVSRVGRKLIHVVYKPEYVGNKDFERASYFIEDGRSNDGFGNFRIVTKAEIERCEVMERLEAEIKRYVKLPGWGDPVLPLHRKQELAELCRKWAAQDAKEQPCDSSK